MSVEIDVLHFEDDVPAAHAGGCIVRIVVRQDLSVSDYRSVVIPQVIAALAQYDKVGLVVELYGVRSWSKRDLWTSSQAGFAGVEMRNLVRISVVGDSLWERAMVLLCSAFLPVKYFDVSKLKEAMEWVRSITAL